MSSPTLQPYQIDLIDKAMSCGALKFGSFKLKSGRISPYFFNAGLLSSGPILAVLSEAFASTIVSAQASSPSDPESTPIPEFDVIFGPAYKGIPFAATTALQLYTQHHVSVGFAYDRKEAKDHGEGGVMVGVPLFGKRVVILDDVMTAGTAVRLAIDLVKKQGGEVVGVIQCLDREEVGQDGVSSTVKEVEGILGKGRVKAILRMRDLMAWLESKGMTEELDGMKEYWDKYGLK
ncbi:orotate phosphoribosyltransferase [Gymnopus androsaceus JB14]|uniref:orotate phosphoribosyltransferase n=1 Tax=Gymnopus androsaceus JB14 TaxID=1447944 RepID=A0A6A4H7C7_9AGAR|nr:orotate phosphoribosyltransferase [Gymnopus androsaceus JB14]